MEYTPFPYQETMLQWLLDHKQAALFCSPGLGKTGVTLKAYDEFHLAGSKGMLVVAPIRVCSITWPKEVKKWDFCRHWTVANLRTPEGIRHWHKGTADIYLINSEMLPTREVRTTCPECKDAEGKRNHCIECNGDGKITRKHPGFIAKYLKGKSKAELPVDVLLIDECFPPGTLVDTPNGPTPIEKIRKGDCILNVLGQDAVVQTHKNEIHHAILIRYSGGEIITSPTHRFFTSTGWKPAQEIQEADEILSRDEGLSLLRGGVCDHEQKPEQAMLQSLLRVEVNRPHQVGTFRGYLRGVRGDLHSGSPVEAQPILREVMLGHLADARIPGGTLTREQSQSGSGQAQMAGRRQRERREGTAEVQGPSPHDEPRERREAEGDTQANRSQGQASRGQRQAHTGTPGDPDGLSGRGVEVGVRSVVRETNPAYISEVLQDRRGPSDPEDCDRGGWGQPQLQVGEIPRPEEGRQANRTRVESVEVLEQGDPRLERFRSSDGLIYFYDLTAEQHPSYSVNGLLVHNCSLAKSHTSKRFNALRMYCDKFNAVWGLTGTPAPNTYLDLFAQIRFIDGGKRLGVSPGEYKRIYFEACGTDQFAKYKLRKGAKEQIEHRLSDLCLTMLSDDYLDVPTCNYTDHEISLPAKAKKEYDVMKKELLLQIESGEIEALNAAALTNKLLQITGGAVYDADRTVHVLHDAKIKALKDLVKRHKGEPILVLTQFKHERARILEAFPEAEMFHEKNLDRWQAGKIKLWIADPRSLSHGIDGLQKGGRIAVWFTLSYSNETYLQTNARLVRTGQSFNTIIYRIIALGTVDEAVVEALREKDGRQQGLFAALKAIQLLEKSKHRKK